MPKKKREIEIEDRDGDAWRAELERRARGARLAGDDGPVASPALPDFRGNVPILVGREIFGRFLVDATTKVVHDCYAATPECEIDAIAGGTFYHFWTEILETDLDEIPCAYCLGG